MNVLTIEWGDECLVQLGNNGVSGTIALVLDFLHSLDTVYQVVRILEDAAQQYGARVQACGELGKKIKEFRFFWEKTHMNEEDGKLSHGEADGCKEAISSQQSALSNQQSALSQNS